MKKKILIFTSSVAISGGRERVTANIVNNIQDSFDITIVALDNNKNSFYSISAAVKIDAIDAKMLHGKYRILKFWDLFKDILKIRRYLKQHKQTGIVIGTDIIINIFLYFANKGLGFKLVAHEHMTYHQPEIRGFWKKLRSKIYPKFSTVVTLTETDKRIYQQHGSRAICIPNALTFSELQKAPLQEKLLLAIGRFSQQKGFDLLLTSVSAVFRKHNDWRLLLVGSGEEMDTINRLIDEFGIRKYVTIEPPTSNVQEKYMQASLFVLSSRYEGLPMVLMEAMSHGLPSISFDCKTGPGDIINNNIDGLLVPAGDTGALTAAINELIEDKQKRDQFSIAAFRNMRRFSPEKIYPRWIELLNTIDDVKDNEALYVNDEKDWE